jgi:hypothetical protein
MLFKKIKDGVVSKSADEYEKIVGELGKIGGFTRE